MKQFILYTTLFFSLWLLAPSAAQQTLNNESIIKLVRSGVSEDLIVQTVNAEPGRYSLGADDIVSLKKARVSDRIIEAMLKKNHGSVGSTAAPAESDVGGGSYPSEIGVYAYTEGQWAEVSPELVNWRSGGTLKAIATMGYKSVDLNGYVNGDHSPNRGHKPVGFCIVTPEGVGITEYQLMRLHNKKDSREFRIMTGGVLRTKAGSMRDVVMFQGKKVSSRTFLVDLASLPPGDYGFLPPGLGAAGANSGGGKMYTFTVTE